MTKEGSVLTFILRALYWVPPTKAVAYFMAWSAEIIALLLIFPLPSLPYFTIMIGIVVMTMSTLNWIDTRYVRVSSTPSKNT